MYIQNYKPFVFIAHVHYNIKSCDCLCLYSTISFRFTTAFGDHQRSAGTFLVRGQTRNNVETTYHVVFIYFVCLFFCYSYYYKKFVTRSKIQPSFGESETRK